MGRLMKSAWAALVGSLLLAVGPAAAETADQAAVSRLLHGTFDRPGTELVVSPIVVSHPYAIAGWTQGEMGGRALLRRKDQDWVLILCAGDGIKSRDGLVGAGVPDAQAVAIARDLASEEAKLPPRQVAMFSRFEGIMMMEGGGEREPARPGGR